MILKRLQIKDFLSHKESVIDFSPQSKMIIDGVSGAGKSSIVDAILWVIYGEGRAGNRDLVRRGTKKAEVELTVHSEAFGGVRITRTVTSSGKHDIKVSILKGKKFFAHEVTGVKALQHWIEHELVGASRELFINSVAYLQGGTEHFVMQPANKRRELLLEIIKAEDYDMYYNLARDRIQSLIVENASTLALLTHQTTRRLDLRSRIQAEDELRANVHALTALASEKEAHINTVKDIVAKRAELEKLLISLDAGRYSFELEISKIEKFEAGAEERRARMAAVETALTKTRNDLVEARALYSIEVLTLDHLKTREAERPTEAYIAVEVIPRQIRLCQEEIKMASEDKQCPSGPDCPFMRDVMARITDATLKIVELEKALVTANMAIRLWEGDVEKARLKVPQESSAKVLYALEREEKALETEFAALSAHMDDAPVEKDKLFKKLAEIDGQVKEARAAIAKLPETTEDLGTLYNELMAIRGKLSEAESELRMIERDKEELVSIEKSIGENEERIAVVKNKIEKLELVKEAFGAKGIRSIVIDYILPRLEERVNEILAKLSEFTIRLDTQTSRVDGGVKEGLFITIINDVGEELPFESYSGGERLKITVAISEALATLQNVKFRIFDELFIGLDEDSTQNFSLVLERLQEEFPQILCISHLRQIKDMFSDVLTVAKYGGISSIT